MEETEFLAQMEGTDLSTGWTWKNGSWWCELDFLAVRDHAQTMLRHGARFVAITVMEREDHELRLDYQWDVHGQLLSFTTATQDKRVATIADLIPAADWAERETWEYFAVEFTGREHTLPLMTRAGDAVGIHLAKEVAE